MKKLTNELDMAIVGARKKMGPVQKSKVGNRNRVYADINDVLDAIEDSLFEFKLTAYSRTLMINGERMFQTVIKHAPTGQSRCEIRPYTPDENTSMTELHAQGSAETYMRRYALVNLLCLRSDEDNDGGDLIVKPPAYQTSSKPIEHDPNFVHIDTIETKLLDLGQIGEDIRITTLASYSKSYGRDISDLKFLKQPDKQTLWNKIKDI